MDKLRRSVARNWPIWLLVMILGASIYCIVVFRSDPNFGAISTVLGILIGGSTTALTQLASQARERALRVEDQQTERVRLITEQRIERLREHLTDSVTHVNRIAYHLGLHRAASKNNVPALASQNLQAAYAIIEKLDLRREIEIAANIKALGNKRLDTLASEIENAMKLVQSLDFANSSNEEFQERYERFEKVAYECLGAIYSELDRLKIQGVS